MSVLRSPTLSLRGPESRAFRAHVVFGDDLAIEGPDGRLEWYQPQGELNGGEASEGHYALAYADAATGDSLTFDFGALDADAIQVLKKIASAGSLLESEKRWAPTLGLLGRLPRVSDGAVAQDAVLRIDGKPFAFARRKRHPSTIFDRFALLDRSLALRDLEALLVH